MSTSREWQIAERLRILIGKLVGVGLTAREKGELHDVQRERVNRMMPRKRR